MSNSYYRKLRRFQRRVKLERRAQFWEEEQVTPICGPGRDEASAGVRGLSTPADDR